MPAPEKPATDGSVSGWPALVAEVQKTFNLLRDVFGYAMPGGVFVGIGLLSHRLTMAQFRDLLLPYTLSPWAAAIVVLAVCYVTGQILAAIAYTPSGIRKYIQAKRRPNEPVKHPTEVAADLLEIRRLYPGFFNSLDRRETITIFVGATTVALLAGAVIFCMGCFTLSQILVAAGLILLVDFWTAVPHLGRVETAIRGAYDLAKADDKAAVPAAQPNDFKQPALDLIKAATSALNK
jgi:hypothetical protein